MNPTFIPAPVDSAAPKVASTALPPISFNGWEPFFGAVAVTFVLMMWVALMVERALSVLFEAPCYKKFDAKWPSAKLAIAYLVSFASCYIYWFDGLAMVFGRPYHVFGVAITAYSVCGGSKWVIAFADKFIDSAKHIRRRTEEATTMEETPGGDKTIVRRSEEVTTVTEEPQKQG